MCAQTSFDITGGSVSFTTYFGNGCYSVNTNTFSSYSKTTSDLYAPFTSVNGGNYTAGGAPCTGGYSIQGAVYPGTGLRSGGGSVTTGSTVTFTVGDQYDRLTGSITATIPTTAGVYNFSIPITLTNRPIQSGSFNGVVTVTVAPC
jgi:hypothetical protein